MTLELIMNQDGIIDHDVGSVVSVGAFVVTTPPSTMVKALAKGVYKGPITGTFTDGDATGFVPGSVAGSWTINPTAISVKAEALAVVRAGDTGTLTAVGTIAPPAAPPTGPVAGTVIVSDAGQDKAHGD